MSKKQSFLINFGSKLSLLILAKGFFLRKKSRMGPSWLQIRKWNGRWPFKKNLFASSSLLSARAPHCLLRSDTIHPNRLYQPSRVSRSLDADFVRRSGRFPSYTSPCANLVFGLNFDNYARL